MNSMGYIEILKISNIPNKTNERQTLQPGNTWSVFIRLPWCKGTNIFWMYLLDDLKLFKHILIYLYAYYKACFRMPLRQGVRVFNAFYLFTGMEKASKREL